MGVNINTKPTIATIDNNDQIFISDDGVALKKVNYTDLAKAIIEQYNASQLAGSAKTVQTAINDLNNNKMNVGLGEVIPNGANLNNYITIGTYRVTSSTAATSITNTPFDSPYMLNVRQGVNADTIIQEVLKHGALMEKAERCYNASNNTWTKWIKQPTRSEVDALESKSYTQVGTELATGQDLNNYKTPGVYYIKSQAIANDTTNIPQAQAGRLVVLPSSNSSYIFQEYYPYVAADRFYRRKFNDSWSQWYMYSQGGIEYKVIKDEKTQVSGGALVLTAPNDSNDRKIAIMVRSYEAGTLPNMSVLESTDNGSTWADHSTPVESTIYDNAGSHNCVYRGKNLGTSVTEAQWAAIKAGTFKNMFIGDYWVIGGFNWRIAAFDYYLNSGDTNTTAHHVVIVPDTRLVLSKMNSTNITTGAYMGSDFYTGANDNVGRSSAIDIVNSAFGSAHILSHRTLLQKGTNNTYGNSVAWYDTTVELMSERMVYGNAIYEDALHGTNIPGSGTVDRSQLPLFAFEHSRIGCRQDYWLRSVGSATGFCAVGSRGSTLITNASTEIGVRPAFTIYQA